MEKKVYLQIHIKRASLICRSNYIQKDNIQNHSLLMHTTNKLYNSHQLEFTNLYKLSRHSSRCSMHENSIEK